MADRQLGQVLRQLHCVLGGPTADASDLQLLDRYACCRDEQAFELLVRRHGPMVQGVCRRVLGQDSDADDAFQAAFLVLARKAGSAFSGESVAGWLYRVAFRTAQKVRVQAARRHRREQVAARRRAAHSGERADAVELRQVLDEELLRLPEQFRLPLLLCCLQDQTIDEAARQLGCSSATVKGRLQRGRERLRQRLQRRGIALSAGVLGTIVTPGAVQAVAAAQVQATVQAAVTGAVSVPVAALVKGATQAMFRTKLKLVAIFALAMAFVGAGVGVGWYRDGVAAVTPIPGKALRPAAPPPLVLRDDANGKTVRAVVGQRIEIQLEGDRPATGWEGGGTNGPVLRWLENTFEPKANATDKAIGTYVFRYQAMKEGEETLALAFIAPGGPGVVQRRRSDKVRDFSVKIQVTEPAGTVSWGEPLNGFRLGLSPTRVELRPGEESFRVEVWYENVRPHAQEVPEYEDSANICRLMFRGEVGGQPFYVDYRADRLAVRPLKMVKLEPGHRFSQVFELAFGGRAGFTGLADLAPGKSLSLAVGWCARGDTQGEKDWQAAGTLRSGAVTVMFAAVPLRAEEDRSKADMLALQGNWELPAQTPMWRDPLVRRSLEVKGRSFTFRVGDRVTRQGTMVLDARKQPKEMDLHDDTEEQPFLAIYQVEGDRLTLGIAAEKARPTNARPTRFEEKPGQLLATYTKTRR